MLVTKQKYNVYEVDRMFNDMETDLIQRIKTQLDTDDINFTGDMSKTVHSENSKDEYFVVVDSPYAKPVEYGLSKGVKVNIDKLRYWVENKLGITDARELEEVTFKIFNKIRAKGIAPKRFVKKAIKSMIYNVRAPVRRKISKPKKSKFGKLLRKISKYVEKTHKITKQIYRVTKQIYKGSQVSRKHI